MVACCPDDQGVRSPEAPVTDPDHPLAAEKIKGVMNR
jgi:hypothetical protein